ncbi:spinster homolog 1-like, partial [Paramuricea clavata]
KDGDDFRNSSANNGNAPLHYRNYSANNRNHNRPPSVGSRHSSAHERQNGGQLDLEYSSVFNSRFHITRRSDKSSDTTCPSLICLSKSGTGKYNTTLPCRWDYDGTGEQYQILAGPVFILVYTITGIPLGFLGGGNKRCMILASCLMLWSIMTLLSGFATKYWHLVVTRFILGMAEAGCTPFASSLIADYFDETLRASAMGVYNWGIYIGYSLSYALGNFIVDANIDGKGWRWVYWIAAIPGFIVAPMILFTVKEPVGKVKKERTSINITVSVIKAYCNIY